MEGRTKVRFFFKFSNFLFRKKIGLQKYVVPIKKVTLKAPFSKYYETSLDKILANIQIQVTNIQSKKIQTQIKFWEASCSDLKKKGTFKIW